MLYPRSLGGAALAALLVSASPHVRAQDAILARVGLDRGLQTRVAIHEDADGGVLAATDFGMLFDLHRHSVRARGFRVLVQVASGELVPAAPTPIRTLRGSIRGLPGSAVAASVLDDGLHARIEIADGQIYWLQPLGTDGAHVMYRAADVRAHRGVCGIESLPAPRPAPLPPVGSNAAAPHAVGDDHGGRDPSITAAQVAELACDADYEFFLDYGSASAAQARIENVVNTMNSQYVRDVGIEHEITTIVIRTTSRQPYKSSQASRLLNQFRAEWNANMGSVQRDAAQLFTGKQLRSNTIGIAWLGTICNTSYGYSVVQSDFNGNFASATDLSAHELGHSWNADHCSCTSYTMNPYITSANRFQATLTIPDIAAFRDSRSCLDSGSGGGGGGGTEPTSVHVGSITVSTPGAGRGSKVGQAVVVVVNDLGQPVAGATVAGVFSGDISQPVSGETGVDGSAVLRTTLTSSGRTRVMFCVISVTASLPYASGDNVETCDNN